MQIVKIDHERCDEPVGTTLMWAPDDKTPQQFAKDCSEAMDALFTAEQAWLAVRNKREIPTYLANPNAAFLAQHSDMTVAEALDLWERAKHENQQQDAARNAARRGFADHMHDLGYLYLYEYDPALTRVIAWGHQHGLTIDVSNNAGAGSDPASADLLGQGEDYPRYTRSERIARSTSKGVWR